MMKHFFVRCGAAMMGTLALTAAFLGLLTGTISFSEAVPVGLLGLYFLHPLFLR